MSFFGNMVTFSNYRDLDPDPAGSDHYPDPDPDPAKFWIRSIPIGALTNGIFPDTTTTGRYSTWMQDFR
jgi:hypothetical protein